MNARMPVLIGVLGIVALASAQPAAAKTINMAALSRSAVEAACTRAGGASYGIRDDGEPYGCASRSGKVDCSADARCLGFVSDLRPITTNSLDAVLGGGVHAGPIKIGPTERRITPAVQP